MELRAKKSVTIKILKNVYWEDYGRVRKVFKTGEICNATEHFVNGESIGVSAESTIHRGISDGLSLDEYEILRSDEE